jgi:GNAT superfamily N-acetyltransferase
LHVTIAATDEEIRACWAVMRELRPHVDETSFVERVRAQEARGYRLAYLSEGGRPRTVAGFRFMENLAWGRFLYVDDLVSASEARSHGHGAALLGWLRDHARAHGCAALHLDSGVQRADAHRFYRREGLALTSYHFAVAVDPP